MRAQPSVPRPRQQAQNSYGTQINFTINGVPQQMQAMPQQSL